MTHPPVEPQWLRNASDTLAVAQGCYFDAAQGEYVCDFIERFCCQSKGRWASQPLELLEWQRDFLMRLFGWRRSDGRRRFKSGYLEVPKKNGKSTMLSALALYLLIADSESAPEIYINACDKEQASIIFDESKRMINASPVLDRRLGDHIVDSRKRIVDPQNNGKIVANSSDVPSKDGANASVVIFDELHRQPDRKLWDVFKYAGISRDQPLRLSITTAGESEDGVWYEQRELSEKVNDGVIPDISHLGVVYRALDTDDLDDPAVWRKANPSFGVTMREEDFAEELTLARQKAETWSVFRRLRFNLIVREAPKWIDLPKWDACAADPGAFFHTNKPIWIGADLSATTDLTAIAVIAGSTDDGFGVDVRFLLPEGRIVELEQKDRVPYREWANQGFLKLTPGDVIDYGFVRRCILDYASNYEIRKVLMDKYNALQVALELRDIDGLNVEFLTQGYLSLSPPTKELARLVTAGKLAHGANPILRWNASNAIASTDPAGNIKLDKAKSREKIDGLAALVNAIAAATSDVEQESVYNARGVLTL